MKVLNISKHYKLWLILSVCVVAIGFGVGISKIFQNKSPLNYGIDFAGGSSIMVKIDQFNQITSKPSSETIQAIRKSLQTIGLTKTEIQITQDKEVIIKTTQLQSDTIYLIQNQLKNDFGAIEVLEVDYIGPSIGSELRTKSILIIILVSAALLAYISWRFQFQFGIAALCALLHDALITMAAASFFYFEINTAFVAAILTILGYSINDTIIIFDRIRENLANKSLSHYSIDQLCNLSIKETLSRTINTSLTTLLVLTSLAIFGGSTIKEFCLILLIGIGAGVYSTIFIATPLFARFYKKGSIAK